MYLNLISPIRIHFLRVHLCAHISVQIEFLEVRLSEVMAYADIPPSMRPALSEFDPVSMIIGKDSGGNLLQGAGGGGLGGGLAGIKAAQVEAVKRSILKSLGMLREIRQSLGKAAHLASTHARTNHAFSDLTLITSVPV